MPRRYHSLPSHPMRRWIAILLLGSYLFFGTELHQFLKVPTLIDHFQAHQKSDPAETFLGFLVDHYLNSADTNAEEGGDHGLPFTCHHDCTAHSFQVFSAERSTALVLSSAMPCSEPHALEDPSYSFQSSRDVWQPPKL